MIDPLAYAPQTDSPTVVISDEDFGDVSVESESLEAAGARVVALQVKRVEDLFDVAPDCAAMINQYAHIGRATIEHMPQCEVIARYGVGVDSVHRGGHLCCGYTFPGHSFQQCLGVELSLPSPECDAVKICS